MFLALISGEALLSAVIYLVIVAVIFWVVQWAISQLPVPEPFNKVIRVLMVLAAALIVISILMALIGHPIIAW